MECCNRQEDSDAEKMQKLTELLNITGYKLCDLQRCLEEEEKVLRGNGYDNATFDPLIDRFLKEAVISESLLRSLESGKPPYQCYLENLLIDRSKRRNGSKGAAGEVQTNSEDCDLKQKDVTSNGTDFVDSPTAMPMEVFIDFTETSADAGVQCSLIASEVSAEASDKISLLESNLYSHSNEDHVGSSSTPRRDQCKNEKGNYLVKEKVEESSYLEAELVGSIKSKGKYNVLRKRANQKSRRPIPAQFYESHQLCSPKSPASYSSNCQTLPLLANVTDSTISDGGDNGGHNHHGTPVWALKSKSANESWYEFKERCSISPVPDRLTPHSKLRVSGSSSGSSFLIKDYMKTTSPQDISPTKSKKSVRFSVSPSLRTTPTKRLQTSPTKYPTKYSTDSSFDDDGSIGSGSSLSLLISELEDYMKTSPPQDVSPTKSKKSVRFSVSPCLRTTPAKSLETSQTKYSSDSSDDDEVGFKNVQFPLAKNLDMSWTNDRRSPRRRYK